MRWYSSKTPRERKLIYVGFLSGVLLCSIPLFFLIRYQFHEQPKPKPTPAYSMKICDDAFEQKMDHYTQEQETHFDVKLREGCFGAFFRPPKSWNTWEYQPIGDDFWIVFWWAGSSPIGPFGPNDKLDFGTHSSQFWRMQGRGTIRIYSNDAIPDH